MNTAVSLQKLPHQDSNCVAIPLVNDVRHILIAGCPTLQPTRLVQKLYGGRRPLSINAGWPNRGGLRGDASIDACDGIVESRDDPRHVLKFIFDR
jgi:hypothetical protein